MSISAVFRKCRRHLFGLPPREVQFDRRGFHGGNSAERFRLETAGGAFLKGYHLALETGSGGELESKLLAVEAELRGFAFEGAAMGLALFDFLTPWRRDRIDQFLRGIGANHPYMIHVGIGWVWARIPFGFRRWQKKLDPLLGWLAFDGWGFHEGFFHWSKYINGQRPPIKLKGYESRAFDQGLGRALWFVNGTDVELIARTISRFSVDRQPDLWSGIGLAATYAGMIPETSLCQLRESAGRFFPQLAQGVAFAAKARQCAGNPHEYTELAVQSLCGMSASEAAQLTDVALENLPADADEPAYEIWRHRIQNHFVSQSQTFK